MIQKTLSLSAVLVFAGLLGCNPSKAELDKTKQDLQAVTAERDGLKGQLNQANSKVAMMQQQLTDMQAKIAAAMAAAMPPAAVEEKTEKKDAKGGKAKAKTEKAPPPSAEKKQEMEQHPETRSGRGHF